MKDPDYFGSSLLNEVAVQIRKYILQKNALTVNLVDLYISTNLQLHYLDGFCELIAMGFLVKPSIRLHEGVFLPTYDFCKKVDLPEEKYMELINKLGKEHGE